MNADNRITQDNILSIDTDDNGIISEVRIKMSLKDVEIVCKQQGWVYLPECTVIVDGDGFEIGGFYEGIAGFLSRTFGSIYNP